MYHLRSEIFKPGHLRRIEPPNSFSRATGGDDKELVEKAGR